MTVNDDGLIGTSDDECEDDDGRDVDDSDDGDCGYSDDSGATGD